MSIKLVPQAAKPCAACVKRMTKEPQGYVVWHEWAERKMRTHDQFQCPDCGRWTIRKPKRKVEPRDQERAPSSGFGESS